MGETQGKTTAQKIIETLYDQGVRHVFGIPGVHNIELYEALAGQDEVKSIVARHEQGAAFMADGYARVSGKVGVAFVITGPGLTNAYTGIAEAYWDSSPIAVFATEIQVPFIGQQKGFIHELPDQKGIIEGVVKRAIRITEPEQVEGLTREALDSAISGRQRPVYIETPLDVLPALINDQDVFSGSKSGPDELSGAESKDVKRAVSLLQQGKRPVIYVGGGIKTEVECQTLIHLAEQLGAPVVTTVKGKGGVPYDHPLFAGVSWAKEIMESDLLKNADVLLAVGTRLSARLKYGGYGDFSLPERLIHIDVDSNVINQNFPTELGICADAVKTMDAISQQIEVDEGTRNEGFKRAEFAKTQVNAS
ncbi:MAG TPA: thiamine pyrophosphate-binding protein [Bacillales bacterium]